MILRVDRLRGLEDLVEQGGLVVLGPDLGQVGSDGLAHVAGLVAALALGGRIGGEDRSPARASPRRARIAARSTTSPSRLTRSSSGMNRSNRSRTST